MQLNSKNNEELTILYCDWSSETPFTSCNNNVYHESNNKEIYATALLANGRILFYWIGDSKSTVDDFYKDFIYANINRSEFEKDHILETKSIGFIIDKETEEFNNFVFNILAKEFFKQWNKHELNPDYRR